MNKLEKLEQEAFEDKVKVHDYYLGEDSLKGIYIDGNVAINTSVSNRAEKTCILAEELGHHYTSVGNILDQSDPDNRKQERKARLWGYDRLIGLSGIIRAFEYGCRNCYEMADYLGVTDVYLKECIDCYRKKYGISKKIGNYIIYFEPALTVGKITD